MIKAQEQQRFLGVLPNCFVAYDPDALPLTARQKFELSWKSFLDPVRFGVVGIVAGVQQARNDFSGFGQGAEGYAKRYGAAYANVSTGGLITEVLMPSLFKQDPRYFYKGTGNTKSRIVYEAQKVDLPHTYIQGKSKGTDNALKRFRAYISSSYSVGRGERREMHHVLLRDQAKVHRVFIQERPVT